MLGRGAATSATDNEGETAPDVSRGRGGDKMVALLLGSRSHARPSGSENDEEEDVVETERERSARIEKQIVRIGSRIANNRGMSVLDG